jgi:hypothetical protein
VKPEKVAISCNCSQVLDFNNRYDKMVCWVENGFFKKKNSVGKPHRISFYFVFLQKFKNPKICLFLDF